MNRGVQEGTDEPGSARRAALVESARNHRDVTMLPRSFMGVRGSIAERNRQRVLHLFQLERAAGREADVMRPTWLSSSEIEEMCPKGKPTPAWHQVK